jgi:hypothetical protein
MSPFVHHISGAPTYTAAPASLSLSGLDELSPVTAMDPNLMDTREWYPAGGDHQHAPLSPQHEHFGMNFGPGFPSHNGASTSHEAMHRRSPLFFVSPAPPAPFPRLSFFFFLSRPLLCFVTVTLFAPIAPARGVRRPCALSWGCDVYRMSSSR